MTDQSVLLSPEKQELLERVRHALADLRATLARGLADPADEAMVRTSLNQLDDLFLLVVVGEFNAGKSAFINALVGESILDEGVTPTTTSIQILRHADRRGQPVADGVQVVTGSAPMLRDVHVVDTPGTNAITREHETLTERFVPRADLILFITSADRPFTESERGFIERIREWGKKVVLVISKADLVASRTDLNEIVSFVTTGVRSLLSFEPEVFTVSARMACAAKTSGDRDDLERSGMPALEEYVLRVLDDNERFRLKLLNPVGVGLRLVASSRRVVAERQDLLEEDLGTVDGIQSVLTGYRNELRRGIELRLAEVHNVLHHLEEKGVEFFEQTVRVARVFDLLNRSKLRADFEREVIGELGRDIEKRVEGVIDWFVASDLQEWREIRERLALRKTEHAERAAGRLAGEFEYDRARLLESAGGAVQQTLDRHDSRRESARLADSVQNAVAGAALLEVGAVGLGTAVTMVASSTVVDVTGILAAAAMAAVGFVLIPRRRRQAKRELHERIIVIRRQLTNSLLQQFESEVTSSIRRIEAVLAPYIQFVEGERARLQERSDELDGIETRLRDIQRALR